MTRAPRGIVFVLLWGSYLSAALLAAGLVWLLLDPDLMTQIGPAMPLADLLEQLAAFNPYAIMQLGVLLLLVTPLVRLLMAAAASLSQGRLYGLLSLAALAFILLSFFLASR